VEEPLTWLGERPSEDVEHFASWRRDSNPSWHVVAWFLVWRIGDGSGTPGASTVFLQGVVYPVEYLALEDKWSLWRLLMEWCGLTSWIIS
jgi:hypothetical protein